MGKSIKIEPGRMRDVAEKMSSCLLSLQSVEADLESTELPPKLEQQSDIGVRIRAVASRLQAISEKVRETGSFLSDTADIYEQLEEKLLNELSQIRHTALSAEEERLKKLEDQFF